MYKLTSTLLYQNKLDAKKVYINKSCEEDGWKKDYTAQQIFNKHSKAQTKNKTKQCFAETPLVSDETAGGLK